MSATTLQSTLKSRDTEEWLDIYFTRPLGLLWARLFDHFGIHPNVVTVLSILLGIGAAWMMYLGEAHYWCNIVGILLLVWANIYDSCDGQLARMTGKKTRWGRILDGFAGDVWFFCIYFAICWRLQDEPLPFCPSHHWGIGIWLLCAFSGLVLHAKQCQLADYYRNIHLYFLKGKSGSELDTSAALRQEFHTLRWRSSDWHVKLYLYFYANYTAAQEAQTPAWQRLRQALSARYVDAAEMPQALRDDFRRGSLPMMKWANILTFNTRAIALYVALLMDEPWLYPAFECLVLTVIWWYMRRKHEAHCTHLLSAVETGHYQTTQS